MINDKSQGSVATHLRCGGLAIYRIIVLIAGERIFKVGTLLAKLQAKCCLLYTSDAADE